MTARAVLPETMTAITITAPGGPEVLRPATVPVPKPAEGEVLLRIAAAGVNRPDVLQRRGLYPVPPGASPLPGLDVAGEVVALGDGVESPVTGDPVTALVNGGGYAEYVAVPAGQCLPVPRGLTIIEAAALPETFFTVWSNVFDRGRLAAGDVLLVHGGSSGIGVAAIQLGAAFGATVFATAGTAEKCEACRRIGAARAIDYREEDFVEVIRTETARGADVILDMVGGDYLGRNIRAAAPDGRIVQIAFLKGAKTEIDLNTLMRNRLTLTGSTLRPRPAAFKTAVAQSLHEKVWPLIENGRIRPVIDSVFPLAEADRAHARLDEGGHIGKVMLQV